MRERVVIANPSSPGARLGMLIGLIVGLAVLFVLLLPLAIVGLLGILILIIIAKIKAWWRSLREPNGPMDGRHNVRVVEPENR